MSDSKLRINFRISERKYIKVKVLVNKLENPRDKYRKDLCKGRYKYENNCQPKTKFEIMTMVVGLPVVTIIFTGRRHILLGTTRYKIV
jgi:hypothetical protein